MLHTNPPAACCWLQGHRAPVADLACDASGGMLASAGADRSVRVWDVDGGFCTHAFTGHRYEGRSWAARALSRR